MKIKNPFKSLFESKKIESCKIEYDSNRLVWYPGEELRGYLYLKLSGPMDMECIEVTCKGKGEVEWKEYHYDENNEKVEREYEADEKIMNLKQKIFGKSLAFESQTFLCS